MAKKAADADGGSRATKISVQWMAEFDILDSKGRRLVVVLLNIFKMGVYQSCGLFIGHGIPSQARIKHFRSGREEPNMWKQILVNICTIRLDTAT